MDKGFWLIICGVGQGPGRGVFRIDEGLYEIGRSKHCHIRLFDCSVSRQHAMLVNDGGKLSIGDLGSQNGTFVDGKAVHSGATLELTVGTSLRIGRVTLDVVDHLINQGHSADDSEATPRAAVRDPADAGHRARRFGPARKQVLSLLLDGLPEKQIATQLDLSPHTVHGHVEAIYDALDVHARGELAAQFRSGT